MAATAFAATAIDADRRRPKLGSWIVDWRRSLTRTRVGANDRRSGNVTSPGHSRTPLRTAALPAAARASARYWKRLM